MNCEYGLYFMGRFYGFETKEKMDEFIERLKEQGWKELNL